MFPEDLAILLVRAQISQSQEALQNLFTVCGPALHQLHQDTLVLPKPMHAPVAQRLVAETLKVIP